ncbi:hypothetical protein HETIRDRAFT_410116 [Heterobasidion irregulare TC 32-1]|uniref:Uncharacterized protein n=1 Tax=Heterobasidion irregulare (strain TC 32-1) TaxID=747525 RepID=W4K530_HETIT|nr:uncharacterized protein HETIRDRAFT_410116 [Heterobasidion irregulare TC 32-1]ETW80923.1 hypothetical protein HETIRDRAFT_410116 [Heterobasidion irregulare TC 32-1]
MPIVVLPDQVLGESRCYSTTYGRNAEAMEKESTAYVVQDGEAIIENEIGSRPKGGALRAHREGVRTAKP